MNITDIMYAFGISKSGSLEIAQTIISNNATLPGTCFHTFSYAMSLGVGGVIHLSLVTSGYDRVKLSLPTTHPGNIKPSHWSIVEYTPAVDKSNITMEVCALEGKVIIEGEPLQTGVLTTSTSSIGLLLIRFPFLHTEVKKLVGLVEMMHHTFLGFTNDHEIRGLIDFADTIRSSVKNEIKIGDGSIPRNNRLPSKDIIEEILRSNDIL